MTSREMLLVEDTADDEALILLAFHKSRMTNDIVVVRDGAKALTSLFDLAPYAGRALRQLPARVGGF